MDLGLFLALQCCWAGRISDLEFQELIKDKVTRNLANWKNLYLQEMQGCLQQIDFFKKSPFTVHSSSNVQNRQSRSWRKCTVQRLYFGEEVREPLTSSRGSFKFIRPWINIARPKCSSKVDKRYKPVVRREKFSSRNILGS